MKFLTLALLFGGICFFNINDMTNGQTTEYPNLYYQPLKFDFAVRGGGFNTSTCIDELLTCWELVRGDVICQAYFNRDTVCTGMKEFCHDQHGMFDIEWWWYQLHEGDCKAETYET